MLPRLENSGSPNPQRAAGFTLILIQAAALGLMMKAPFFAVSAAAVGVAGWHAPERKMTRNINLPATIGLIIVLFCLRYLFAPAKFPMEVMFIHTEAAFDAACCCLVIQLLTLFAREYERRLPIWFLTISGLGFVLTGDVRIIHDDRRLIALALTMMYLIAWGLFASYSRQTVATPQRSQLTRSILIATVLFVSVGSGAALSEVLFFNENRLDRMLSPYLNFGERRMGRAGFSGLGGLSDVSTWQRAMGETISLRVVADKSPGYLRGRAFDEFTDDRWDVTMDTHKLFAEHTGGGRLSSDARTFRVRPGELPAHPQFVIWPVDLETANHFFLPIEAAAVRCAASVLQIDDCGIVQRPLEEPSSSYDVFTAMTTEPESPAVLQDCLQLPGTLNPRVTRLAQELCDEHETSEAKINAVRTHFHQNFSYELGIRIPRSKDRLSTFLFEEKAAHCEYFATATAILLRIAGVPARYVTGFVAEEQNHVDGSWIARRKHSHAWTEAYDRERQRWVIVESTPDEGIPRPAPPSLGRQTGEAMHYQYLRAQEFFSSRTLMQLALAGGQGLVFVLLAAGGIATFALVRGRWGERAPKRKSSVSSTPWSELQEERILMDRYVASHGVHRGIGETVLRFASRVQADPRISDARQVADWYRRYVSLRFLAETIDDQTQESVQHGRQSLTRRKRMWIWNQTQETASRD